MKPLCPRHKRLKREGRLQAAKHWLPKYEGKSIVKGYSKHFGVNKIYAVLELRMLGYEISDDYLEKLKEDELLRQKQKERRKREKELNLQDNMYQYLDEMFRWSLESILVILLLSQLVRLKRCISNVYRCEGDR